MTGWKHGMFAQNLHGLGLNLAGKKDAPISRMMRVNDAKEYCT